MYNANMKYDWNPDKNEWLKKERNISFEQIIFHLSQGDLWKITEHPDHANYPGQNLYFVVVNDYIFIVDYPFRTVSTLAEISSTGDKQKYL